MKKTAAARGRRPGENRTRQTILDAARRLFAQHGYERASVRAVAREAGVDPALVLHFYGSKEQLFTRAVEWPFDADDAVERIVKGARSRVGRRLADFFLAMWEEPANRELMLGMLRGATTSDHAATLLRDVLRHRVLRPVAVALEIDDADLRMSLCAAHIVGIGITRYVVRLEPIAAMGADELGALVAPVFQRYLTGTLARP
jgi:AcrR family transcriptional regulator